ncbi:MAG: PHP domain-containing protein [Frankiaceae bacterium]|nr:PHP domain-containing protein [Frankiaceae bacterium]MBV9871111.1 PHP domain-containing protein [Frankiaceae bacterium]
MREIAYLLERTAAATPKVKAFRNAANVVEAMDARELEERVESRTLTKISGIGDSTATAITESLAGKRPSYFDKVEADLPPEAPPTKMQQALRGDLHMHSDWSDGGSPIEEMMQAAKDHGHEYVALTDHSPRLTVARGLTAERLREQIKIVRRLNEEMAPFRILTGIEVDILDDGSLDQEEDLLAELDIVVASVHSKLRMDADAMTRRMVTAVANPHTDVLGHCTGRLLSGRGRAESEFNAEIVFEACKQFGVAVEINSRPERLDPPMRLLELAMERDCIFSIDTDAHAPGQLEWQSNGCERAEKAGLDPNRVINTMTVDDLLNRERPEPTL